MTSAPVPLAEPMMPLDHAHDALGDMVSQFHNYMLRRGIKELPPMEWVEEFRSWLDPYDFERRYAETLKWLAEAAVTATPAGKPLGEKKDLAEDRC